MAAVAGSRPRRQQQQTAAAGADRRNSAAGGAAATAAEAGRREGGPLLVSIQTVKIWHVLSFLYSLRTPIAYTRITSTRHADSVRAAGAPA